MATDSAAYARADTINENAINWLSRQAGSENPFFLWVHYMDVHYPFQPPEEHLRELGLSPFSPRRVADLNGRMQEDPNSLSEDDRADLMKLYDAEIRYTDDRIGDLLDHLKSLDIRDDTVVVVCSGHGEAFGEHGRFGHHPHNYDELVHVPLVFSVPGRNKRRIEQQVSLIDVPPTLYELCDIETPEATQGESLVPFMNGEKREDRTVICTASGGDMLAARTPEWKCLWDREKNRVELYDILDDPGERHDLSSDNSQVVERFKSLFRDHVAEARATDTDLPEVEESEEVKQRLEDLGYVD